MAGESASASARRLREKAERLQRSAELWERGAAGEQATAAALAQLPAGEWAVMHDVRWPGRQYANVDHVVVGPGGVFVVDSKNWSGTITASGGELRQNGRRRESAVSGAAEAGRAVAELIEAVPARLVQPVLCFVRDEPLVGASAEVLLCSTANLLPTLLSRPVQLTPEQVRKAASELRRGLAQADERRVVPTPRASRPSRRPVAGARSRSGSGRKSRPVLPDLVRLVACLVVIWLLLTQQELVSSAAGRVGEWIVELGFGQPEPPTEPRPNRP